MQFDENDEGAASIRAAAWAHLKMSDVQYMPLERMRLMGLLAKWGAFPHIQVSWQTGKVLGALLHA